MTFFAEASMNSRNNQLISLLHKPKNAKSFGEGSYVFNTPSPLYEHGLQNEESRGIGYYMPTDEEDKQNDSLYDFFDNNDFDGNLDKFREDIGSDGSEYDDYDSGVEHHDYNYDNDDNPSSFEYSEDSNESEYDTNEYNNEEEESPKEAHYNTYDYPGDEDSLEAVNDKKPTNLFETGSFVKQNQQNHNLEDELKSNSNDGKVGKVDRRQKPKFSKSIMDKFYSYLSQRFENSQKKSRRGKGISFEPESRQQKQSITFGSKKGKVKEHHHHHFDQEHEHIHQHNQKHGHEHEHVENHTYYNNHKHNHKHDHFHEHEEKHEHKQGHRHLHSHLHEHKGHGHSSHDGSTELGEDIANEQKDPTDSTKGYNNDVKAYINKHNIKTYDSFKDFEAEHNDGVGDYLEEVEYIVTE